MYISYTIPYMFSVKDNFLNVKRFERMQRLLLPFVFLLFLRWQSGNLILSVKALFTRLKHVEKQFRVKSSPLKLMYIVSGWQLLPSCYKSSL